MLTGWQPRFPIGRRLNHPERSSELRHDVPSQFSPDDAFSLIAMNSQYIDFVDRSFKVKGMAATLSASLMVIFFTGVNVNLFIQSSEMREGLAGLWPHLLFITVVVAAANFVCWWVILRNDLFQYTHYPVRFNRITRKIYFFRHNGPGGVTVVPWGSPYAFFHIGRGAQNPELVDLRCHLLDRNQQIQQTFTIGHFWEHEDDIREPWALICRYMQDSPENCYDDPRDRVITLSSDPTLRNCWLMVILMMGTAFMPFRKNVMFPVYGALTLCRWLTFKTCRKPVFPPEIEAECQIDPEDPYRLPEPRFMAEFASDPAIYARALERHKERVIWRPEK